MKTCLAPTATIAALLATLLPCHGEIKVVTARQSGADATASFKLSNIPAPSPTDVATLAKFTVVDGQRDRNGGELSKLNDGKLPTEADQPAENFFFSQGTDGGRLLVDLGTNRALRQINTYSWHAGARGPQVYMVYASDGSRSEFQAEPKRTVAPASCGWRLLARVDTRGPEGPAGGQYGVSITESSGDIGSYRYLLFDMFRTETEDAFGNTFFSEIDVIDPTAPPAEVASASASKEPITRQFTAGDGKYQFTMNTTLAPTLTDWADDKLRPVIQEWYPKLVALLPSEGFTPRTNVTIRFRTDMGGIPASAGGGFINCNAGWFQKELKREALGSVVHEMVHVVQNYGRVSRNDPDAMRMPGWLVEGIPDYIRWFLYEPQTKGAEITKRNLANAKYDSSYRVTGNFLNWVSTQYDSNIVVKLNAAGRAGKYREELWKETTGKTVQALGEEWKKLHEQRLSGEAPAKATPPAGEAPKPSGTQ